MQQQNSPLLKSDIHHDVQRASHSICAWIGRGKCMIIWLYTGLWCIHKKLYTQCNSDTFLIVPSFFCNGTGVVTIYEQNDNTKKNQWQICKFFFKTNLVLNLNSWIKVVFILIYVSANQNLPHFRKYVSERQVPSLTESRILHHCEWLLPGYHIWQT